MVIELKEQLEAVRRKTVLGQLGERWRPRRRWQKHL